MNEYTFLVCCIPFFTAALFHLISCLLDKTQYADASKVILMPLLIAGVAVFYFFCLKNGDTGGAPEAALIILLCAALAAGNAGDIFLLGEVTPVSMAKGLCSFLAGHIVYIVSVLIFIPFYPLSPLFILSTIAVYAAAVCASWFLSAKPKGMLGFGVIIYASVLAAFSLFVLLRLAGALHIKQTQDQVLPLIRLYIGTMLFLASDSILSRTIFVKPFMQSRFVVMSTYIGAQFFIAWGFCTL